MLGTGSMRCPGVHPRSVLLTSAGEGTAREEQLRGSGVSGRGPLRVGRAPRSRAAGRSRHENAGVGTQASQGPSGMASSTAPAMRSL